MTGRPVVTHMEFDAKGFMFHNSATARAPVAQLDRASASGAEGHRFESCRARHPRIHAISHTEETTLLRFLLLIVLFGWLLRIGIRLLRFLQSPAPPPDRTPRDRRGPRARDPERPADQKWDEGNIEEADYEELP